MQACLSNDPSPAKLIDVCDAAVSLAEPPCSVADVLRERAQRQPADVAFHFLVDGELETRTLRYGDLHRHACAIARQLQDVGAHHQRVLLLFEAGLDYVCAFFGCLMAGATAVPAYPPMGSRALERLAAVAADSAPAVVLTQPRFGAMKPRVLAALQAAHGAPAWLEVDTTTAVVPPGAEPSPLHPAALAPECLALLQYTSGSTAQPKGVMLTHGNLLANCKAASHWMGSLRRRIGCTWLPPYHDMGLMGGILQPVYEGFPTVILSPGHFVQRPWRWLAAIARHRVTTTIAPNFALDLCVSQVSDEELHGLDLSTLQDLYCGAEPVRQHSFEAFARRFVACGFDRRALGPCYGLAEATVFVTGKPAGTQPRFLQLDKGALAQGRVEPVAHDAVQPATTAIALASCGLPAPGHALRIVDPSTSEVLPEDRVGEIWFAAPNVAAGYWHRSEASAQTFHGSLPGDARRYLRTGDLGFLHQGELHVTGRLKDLIIVAGRNLYPHDIELCVEQADPRIRPNGVVAVGLDDGVQEGIALAVELKRGPRLAAADLQPLHDAVVERVTSSFGVAPRRVHFAPMGAIPVTTSGKLRRQATKAALLDGTLAAYLRD